MSKVELYYFSGTGNSLFVAKELRKKIPDSVIIPIVNLLDRDIIQTDAKTIGVIFPCHALTIPIVIKRFLKKINLQSSEYIGRVNYFFHDDKCNGCGLCEKVCLSGKIKVIDGKPVWQKKILCYMCYACVNYCPRISVQVGDIPGVKSYTTKNGRYPHPYATINDISLQKKVR